VSLEILQSWLALVVAAVSIGIAFYGVKLQRQNNLMSVRPLPYISCADYEDLLWVKMRNDGVGPLLVRNILFTKEEGPGEFANLVQYLPPLPDGLHWSKLSKDYVRTVPVGSDLPLIEVSIDPANPAHVKFREACRKSLSQIEIAVDYTDMHGSSFEPVSRDLDWFGQRLGSSRARRA
jgi:hypothetical protein